MAENRNLLNPNDDALISAIGDAKTHVYRVETLFEEAGLRRRIGKWHLAASGDVNGIMAHLERSYSMCVEAMKGSSEPDRLTRVFEEEVTFEDCGHLHLDLPRPHYENMHSLEERISGASPYQWNPSMSECLRYLTKGRDARLETLSKLSSEKWASVVTKSDLAGNLVPNEVRFLCKSCKESFVEVFDLRGIPEFGGFRFLLRKFVERLAANLGGSYKFFEPYGLGVVKARDGKIAVMNVGNAPYFYHYSQPAANIKMFNPTMIVALCNFFRGRWSGVDEWEGRRIIVDPWKASIIRGLPDDPKIAMVGSVSRYSLPTLVYDCDTDKYEYMAIESMEPSLQAIVARLRSTPVTVKSSGRSSKVEHEVLVETFQTAGASFGFEAQSEYPFGPDRVDVVWLNGTTHGVEVAIEVELRDNPAAELWKLVELGPKLAVIAVKGNQYDQTLARIAGSKVLPMTRQTLMIMDLIDRRGIVFQGGKVLEGNRRDEG